MFGFFWVVVALVILQFDQASVTTVGVLIGIMFFLSGLQQLMLGTFTSGWLKWVLCSLRRAAADRRRDRVHQP